MSRKIIVASAVFQMVMFGVNHAAHGTIRYVKEGAAGSGSSWSDASGDLQAMINASSSVGTDEVWVAAGTYKPTVMTNAPDERSKTFSLKSGVKVYGGFFGNETALEERDIEDNPTILSGDIGEENDPTDNCYHVVTASGVSEFPETRLDGITIRDGFADGSDYFGAGLLIRPGTGPARPSSPRVVNCTFENNIARENVQTTHIPGRGGAVDSWANSLVERNRLFFQNCRFFHNEAAQFGGAVHFFNAEQATFIDCTFIANSVTEMAKFNSGGGRDLRFRLF